MRRFAEYSMLLLSMVMSFACSFIPAAQSHVQTPSGELKVFAAASLTDTFETMGQSFQTKYTGTRIMFNFAGSQHLVAQIDAGASADVIALANKPQMEALIEAEHILSGIQQNFAHNRLVIILPQTNPAGLTMVKDLARSGIKLILADPDVPVGRYTLDFLKQATQTPGFDADFQDHVLRNVVSYEDNVRAVLTKISLNEADAGIVYASDVTAHIEHKIIPILIPDTLNSVVSYPIAPLKDAHNPVLAQQFIDFVLSSVGQAILAEYGFLRVNTER